MSGGTTVRLQGMLDVWLRTRDQAARDRLIRYANERLERLARKMRLGFFGGRGPADTMDVLQDAMLELTKSFGDPDFMNRSFFEKEPPPDLRDFFRFAAFKIRRVLIGLVRKQRRRAPVVPLHASPSDQSGKAPAVDPSDSGADPVRPLERKEFDEAVETLVEQLPERQREVFDLLWTHELSQAEACEVLGVDVRTIKRDWQKVRLHLSAVFKD